MKQSELSFHQYVEFSAPADGLDDPKRILAALREAAGLMGSKVLDESWHKFEPQGVTALLLLSTSHIAIHTWPEYETAQLDVLSCNREHPIGPAVEHVVGVLGGKITEVRKAAEPWVGGRDGIYKGSGVKPSEETPGAPFFTTFGILTPFGDKIMPMFPKEAPGKYVELFCGNGEMLWCHPKRAKVEVINDLDPRIVRLHKLCQGLSDGDLEKLRDMEWKSSKGNHDQVVKLHQSGSWNKVGDLEFFRNELYLRRFTKSDIVRKMPRWREESDGQTMNPFDRIARCRARLKGVEISSRDYKEAIRKYDGSDTFWFIDPPYPEEDGYYPFKAPDMTEQAEQYAKLKGKALIVIEGSDAALKPIRELGWKEFKFRWPRKWHSSPGGPKAPYVLASMFANYQPPASTKKAYWYVEKRDDGGEGKLPMRPAFVTYGVLTRFSKRILPLFPKQYDTYVELFCGNGEMIWCHHPMGKEVMNDLDPTIIRLHKIVQKITDAQLDQLEKMDWTGHKSTFERLKKAGRPKGDLDFLHREAYVRRFNRLNEPQFMFRSSDEGVKYNNVVRRIRACRDRMKGVEVTRLDYKAAIKKFDSPNTMFFIDPPYPGSDEFYEYSCPDTAEMAEALKSIKGSALFIYVGDRKNLGELNKMGWRETRLKWPLARYDIQGDTGNRYRYGIMLTNYNPPVGKEDGVIDLSLDGSEDLEELEQVAELAKEYGSEEQVFQAHDEIAKRTGAPEVVDGKVECKISVKSLKTLWKGCDIEWIKQGGCGSSCCSSGGKGPRVVLLNDEVSHLKRFGATIVGNMVQHGEGRYCHFLKEDGLCKIHDSGHKPLLCQVDPLTVLPTGTVMIRRRAYSLKCYKAGNISGYEAFAGSLKALFGAQQTSKIKEAIKAGEETVTAKMDAKLFKDILGIEQSVSKETSDASKVFDKIDVSVQKLHITGVIPAIMDDTTDDELKEIAKELQRIYKSDDADMDASGVEAVALIVGSEMQNRGLALNEEIFKTIADKAEWTTAYINDLPDSAFLHVEAGGKKDEGGKTVPRTLRHFPVRDADGNLDQPHVVNAIARIPQSKVPGLTDADKTALQDQARKLLEELKQESEKTEKALGVGSVPILKTKEEQYVLGVVLEPNDGKDGAPMDPDSQDDIYSAEEIRGAAFKFMEDFRNVGLNHKTLVNGKVKILESYISPVDFYVAKDGETFSEQPKNSKEKLQKVREGTWLLGLRVVDKALWSDVKANKLTGLSIGGSARRVSASKA